MEVLFNICFINFLKLRGKDLTKSTIGKVHYIFCFIKFLPNQMVEAAEARKTLFRAPLTPWFGVWG